MKVLIITICSLVFNIAYARTIDTLVDVGKYKLHFTIIPGEGIPILFEAGGGNDGGIWNGITKHVAEITGATVITYDRPGLGKSGMDSTDTSIQNDITALERGLIILGFNKRIMLVSHSLGGFYNTLYASRNPGKVRAIVFIDVNLPCFFTQQQFEKMSASQYFKNMVATVSENPLPGNIPVIDIVSENTLFEGTPDADRWKACHNDFVNAASNRKQLIAYKTGHYIFLQNSQLVINSIVSMYANEVMPIKRSAIIEKGYARALQADNDNYRNFKNHCRSEDDLNDWGYSFLQKNDFTSALEIFKLNALLHPRSANVYDSLGDAYFKAGNKDQAIKNYQKALELDPEKKSARKTLELLLQ